MFVGELIWFTAVYLHIWNTDFFSYFFTYRVIYITDCFFHIFSDLILQSFVQNLYLIY